MIEVTTPIKGRLGNHLFQVGAICSYANAFGYKPVFSFNWSSNEACSNSLLLQKIEVIDQSVIENFHQLDHNFFDYKDLPKLHVSTNIFGEYCFFQDTKYLNKKLLLELFSVPELKAKVKKKYPDIESKTCIHVRRGDYLRREKIGSNQFIIPSLKYYQVGIEICQSNNLIIFSDDIEWCRKKFRNYDAIYSDDDEDSSIIAMSLCKNAIISASTFGWWGAYLNGSKDKKVIAPSQWFRSDAKEVKLGLTTPETNLIPTSWTRVNPYQKRSIRIGVRLKKIRRSLFKK